VSNFRRTLWLAWSVCAAILAVEVAIPYLAPPRPDPWHPAQTALAGFILAIFSLAAAEGTFALRESLVVRDAPPAEIGVRSLAGVANVRVARFFTLWALCALIGFFGALVAYGSANPAASTPYAVAAAVLLAVHAPRPKLLARLGEPAGS
jgi:hypothetical protein